MTTNTARRPRILAIAASNAYTVGRRQTPSTYFQLQDEGKQLGISAEHVIATLRCDLDHVAGAYRSNPDPAKVYSVNLALRTGQTPREATAMMSARPGLAGMGAGVLTTYHDGTQTFLALNDLVGVLLGRRATVSNRAPVLSAPLPTCDHLPYTEGASMSCQAAAAEAAGEAACRR